MRHLAILLLSLVLAAPAGAESKTTIRWNAVEYNTDGSLALDLVGYKLYRGTSPGVYAAPLPIGLRPRYSFSTPVVPGKYYLAISAYNNRGLESAKSDEIVLTIRPPAR